MGWKGAALGGYVGFIFGGSLGAVFGAYLGHGVEQRLSRNGAKRQQRSSRHRTTRTVPHSLDAAYATIGASPSDDMNALRRKYHELAKRNHPDALRSHGATEFEIEQATLRMSRINEAWAEIRSYRNV